MSRSAGGPVLAPGTGAPAPDVLRGDDGEAERARRVPTWEEVATRYGGFLYTLAFRLTSDRHDAEDLVQETLLRVRKGLATYVPGSLEGWLARIATNAFIDQTRRQRRRQVDLFEAEDLARHLPDSPAAEEAWAGAVLGSDLQSALMELSVEYRVPVVLCDVAGRSYQEIAEMLDVPVGTVRSRIHRGRQALRRSLAADG